MGVMIYFWEENAKSKISIDIEALPVSASIVVLLK
jgi:hypothetical protein